jgi:PAS domain S-box-containing protein
MRPRSLFNRRVPAVPHPGLAADTSLRTNWFTSLRLWVLLGTTIVAGAHTTVGAMSAAPEGVVESGVPSFVVLGREAIGLTGSPTDIQLMPDGRVLATSQREIAFGDGIRWEVFRAADDSAPIHNQVAVDANGTIYSAVEGGIARLELTDGARWRLSQTVSLPQDDESIREATLISIDTLSDRWLWHALSGVIVSWRPSEPVKIVGNVAAIGRVFPLGSELFASETASGGLFRLPNGAGTAQRVASVEHITSETITSSVRYSGTQVLVGTTSSGLKLFDGQNFTPFGPPGLLNSGHQISDLCTAGDNYFAAAVDTVGIVFFNRSGRIVQVLDHSMDHQLGRVKRLLYASNGVLWALLNKGIARVEFPSPFSDLEPLIASSLAYAQPVRHAGKLWILADGRAARGVYDVANRLERFENDTPAGRYLFTLQEVDGELMGSNELGIYTYHHGAWELVLPGIVNARIGMSGDLTTGALYVGRGEIGFVQRVAGHFTAKRVPLSNLGDNYNAVADADGIVWLELGTSGVGRVDPHGDQPKFELFGKEQGLIDGWPELYVLDGLARLHLQQQLFRFDDTQRSWVPDTQLLKRYPQLAKANGRPIRDKFGKLWYMSQGTAHVIKPTGTNSAVADEIVDTDVSPTDFTVEDDGTIWFFGAPRLSRMNPQMPATPVAPLKAIITSVQYSTRNFHVFKPGATLAPIEYADNSLTFHFGAPSNPFGEPVTFQVRLEGAGTAWVSTGSVGSFAFNRLKEGAYVFHVRPVVGDRSPGAAAQVAFTVRPPWYRSPLAWVVYVTSALGLLAFAAWFPSFLQRRENMRLEHLVTKRTEELNVTNQQLVGQIDETTQKSAALSASEERFRKLNAELEQRVSERTGELSLSNKELQHRESLFRLIFEHAPLGISWKRADLGEAYHFNSTFRRILDLEETSLKDYTVLAKLLHPDDVARQAESHRLLRTGKTDSYNLEIRFMLKESRIVWASLSVAVIRDGSGQIVQDIGMLEDITARKRAEEQLATTYKNLVDASRMAGMAEVATGVLHNVGNVLNSLNVSANLITSSVRHSKVESLVKLSALVEAHPADLADFLTNDRKGKLIPEVLIQIARQSAAERDALLQEIASMQSNIDHIKDIISMQQGYATAIGVVETLDAPSLFEDALRMNTAALARHDVTVVREYLPVPQVAAQKGKVLQILINLIRNAKYACDDGQKDNPRQKVLTMRIEPTETGSVRLIVTDNGIGIPLENLTRIFAHGFTTRVYGHGFGLHSSALAAREMKGSLIASSDGPGRGATFVLELPIGVDDGFRS